MDERIRLTQINPHVWLMDDAGESTGYLVIGQEKAAVIDTMNGWANVKEAIITPKLMANSFKLSFKL